MDTIRVLPKVRNICYALWVRDGTHIHTNPRVQVKLLRGEVFMRWQA